MSARAKSFIPVDDLVKELTLEQVERLPTFYDLDAVSFTRNATGEELRSRCFLACGKEHKGDERSLAINVGHPAKRWYCHGCDAGGNFVSLCHSAKTGELAGKVKGDAFKKIAADIRAMAETVFDVPHESTINESGTHSGEPLASNTKENAASKHNPKQAESPPGNVPLRQSDNERARALVDLDRKFIREPEKLPPSLSSLMRRLDFLTPEVCRDWRMGYLPSDGGEDRSGGTMRGRWVFPVHSTEGELLTWFGWDTQWQEKHQVWQKSNRKKAEPLEYRFVKGYLWGLELFGQDRIASADGTLRENLDTYGLFVVRSPLEAIYLTETHGMGAVATCGHPLVRSQATKAAKLSHQHANGIVHLLADCTEGGEAWLRQGLGFAAQAGPVSLPFTSKQYGEMFAGRSLLSVTQDEWAQTIAPHVRGVRS